MKRSTAIQRLGDIADALDQAKRWPEVTMLAGYVYGALLGDAELERVELALVVNEPPATVPWLANPPRLEALAELLRLKLPVSWQWRPGAWPVWNHAIDRAVRFWGADEGRDHDTFTALSEGRFDDLEVEAPPDGEALFTQMLEEHGVARAHLARVTESFYDQQWRRQHRGGGIYPEQHLWSAATAFLELDDALHQVDVGRRPS